eukprot:scaffold81944_cov58-Attheya_sp.AAC.3
MDVSSSSSSSSHQTSHLATGVLQVKGEGTASFLHSKFSQSFCKLNVSQQHNNNKGMVQETCWLTARGWTLDLLQ